MDTLKLDVELLNEDSISLETITSDSYSTMQVESESNLSTITQMADETVIRKGYSPYIDETTGTWFEYDEETKAFIDTGVTAKQQALDKYLHIGTYSYNGSEDVTIPVYSGEIISDNNDESQIMTLKSDENDTMSLMATDSENMTITGSEDMMVTSNSENMITTSNSENMITTSNLENMTVI